MRLLIPVGALAVAVIFHELGHWMFARVAGVGVPEFSIGFGPRLLSRRALGTRWILRAFPLGAAARVEAMHVLPDARSAAGKGPAVDLARWQRLLVIMGGSLLNSIVAYLLLVLLYCLGTHVPVPLTIGTVQPQSEAARARLLPGDQLVLLDQIPLGTWSDLTRAIAERGSRPLTLVIRREGRLISVGIEPAPDEQGSGALGVAQQYRFERLHFAPAVRLAGRHVARLMRSGASGLMGLLRGNIPVGQALLAVSRESDRVSQDADALLRLFVALSLALATFQLVPLPSLDGGRLAQLLTEWIIRRRIPHQWEVFLHSAGLFAWLALIGWLLFAQITPLLRRVPRSFESQVAATASPVDGGTLAGDAGP